MKKLYLWAREKVHSPYAAPIFMGLVFIEAFLFMPVNTLLTLYGVEWPKRAFFFAFLGVIASVAGACFAYGLGYWACNLGLQKALAWLLSDQKFEQISKTYAQHEIGSVFILSLMPVPFKIVTLTAGFFKIPFYPFVASVAAARFIRFFGLATALYIWGDAIQKIVDRYFYYFIALAVAVMVVSLFLLHK